MKKLKLSKRMSAMVESLAEAAKAHGWEADQGTLENALSAASAYDVAYMKLHNAIARLEARQRRESTVIVARAPRIVCGGHEVT